MSKILNELFNHERYETVAVAICAMLLIWFYGCESKIPSILNPLEKVTRAQFELEIDSFYAKAELRLTALDKQDELKRLLFEKSLLIAQGGAVNPIGIVTSLAAILGIGATVDNVRTRKKLKKAENGSTS